MRRVLLSAIFLAYVGTSFGQKSVEGNWLGNLDVGGRLRIVFHISKNGSGYDAKMDSPDQGAKDIAVSSVTATTDSLHLKVDMLKGGFDGAFVNDTTVIGILSQGPAEMPLTLIKTKADVGLKRPQTPKAPFGYKSDDVEYDNADKSVHFGATLTYPASGGKFPAAILITGSGQQDRDESIMEHKPFAVLADYLTRQGFAVLRVDDRGRGKTKGEVATATSADFANDVEASLAFLRKQWNVDTGRLGLIGHSEGGLIAALVGSRRRDIAFIVLLASPGETGAALLAAQNEAVLKSQGINKEAAASYSQFYLDVANETSAAKNADTALINSLKIFENWKTTVSHSNLEALGMAERNQGPMIVAALVKAFGSPWMKYFLKSNAADLFAKTNAKVLALNGEKDIQVIAQPNLDGIKAALEKSKSKSYETKILPGLNHLFQHCKRCDVGEYGQLEETFSPEALQIIGDWMRKEVK